MDPAELQKRILAAFQIESEEQLGVLHAFIEHWPASVETQLDEAFRMAHSMKGGARVCGLAKLEEDAHELENFLSKLANQELSATPETLQKITHWVDRLEDEILSVFRAPTPSVPESTNFPKALEEPADPEARLRESRTIRSNPSRVAPPMSNDVLRVNVQHFDTLLKRSNQVLFELVNLEGVTDQIEQLTADFEAWRKEQAAANLLHRNDESHQLARMGLKLLRIKENHKNRIRNLKMLAEKQQDEIREIGMVPIQSILEGFPRMVREISDHAGKLVQYKTSGVEQRADRNVLQALKDPIMHAIRNSISHGIELPEERHKRRKATTGTIEILANIEGNRLILFVRDDGHGIDYEKLRGKVKDYTNLPAEEVEKFSHDELAEFLFQPRFSTADHVSSVSGRGVGLSVVHERAKHFQGSATIYNRSESGTELRIEVPIAIAAHPLILVKAGDQIYAVPQQVIYRLERCHDLHMVEGKTTVLVDHQPYTLVTMTDAAGIEAGIIRSESGHFEVILLNEDSKFALHVEEILGEKHALIHPLPYPASLSPYFSGAIFLENGELALVLSTNALLQRFQGANLRELKSRSLTPKKPTILLADDSFTARTLQKSILETAGYQVHIAVDGKAAFDLIRVRPFDLVVSDVQMPNMDGFQLLEAIKKEKNLAHIPVVLVTSLSSATDQNRGFSLGADAYIIKERFDHRELLDTIGQLI